MSALETQGLGMVPIVIETVGPRRARLRHLHPPAARARDLPGRPGQRPDRQPGRRADAVPREREPGQGHLACTSTRRAARSAPGLSIYDTMQFIKPDVSTLCMGMAASMGAFLLMAGAKGKRFALPNSRVMIHQPSGGAQGQATDIEIQAREILKTREQLNQHLRRAHRPADREDPRRHGARLLHGPPRRRRPTV